MKGISEQEHRKVGVLGLTGSFGALVASDDIGITKPDPRLPP